MRDPFVLECNGVPRGARVIAFDGVEEISTTFRYEIDVAVDADADLGDIIGADATLTVRHGEAESDAVHGVIASASVLENMDQHDVHRLVLVPRVWEVLALDRHSRVFVGETVPAIVQTLLHEAGFHHDDCEFRLSRSYEPIDFVCQYRESTLDFLMRWMERDGIYFYFAHDGKKERLVILDDRQQQIEAKVQAPYQSVLGLGSQALRRFRAERRAVPGRVHVDDYDYLRPALPVRGHAVVEGGNAGELRMRGAKVTTPKDAMRIAELRAEGLRARRTIFHGEGSLAGLHAGEQFTLSGHPRSSLDGVYLVTKLRVRGHHTGDLGESMKKVLGREGESNEVLRVELAALWGEVQFRPELRTQPPRVYSMEGGVIEGDAESEYAQIDEHGRYLVKFRFDERDGRGSKASAKIRMMQPHAGNPEGMHFPLRKGTEVLVAFLGGDPDRPVIAGAVPNSVNPAVVYNNNATKNIIHTGGGNRIVMEDEEGKQYIHISSPHKGSYIHIGSPFNPQYNKVTNTSGTSLTYTQDISTSVTGTDAQTIVEDARITIIGRSNITAGDTRASEITALLGPAFVSQPSFDKFGVLFEQIAADTLKLSNDVSSLGRAVAHTPFDAAAVGAAIAQVFTDLQAVYSDAKSYDTIAGAGTHPTGYTTPPGFSRTTGDAWVDAVGAALAAVTQAETAAAATPPVQADLTSAANALVGAATSVVSGAPTSSAATTQPVNPSPSVTPSYILLSHAASHNTTLSATATAPDPTAAPVPVDTYITSLAMAMPSQGPPLETSDGTAINGPGAALHPGSDIKVVGGDNVTIAALDARSETGGHSFSLVGRNKDSSVGQTSVVFGGVRSTVYSMGSTTMAPTSFDPGGPDAPAPATTTAQQTQVYGDTFSVVDGTVNSTIHGDQHTTVISRGSSWVSVTSEIHGSTNAYVLGSRSAEIVGFDTVLVGGAKTSLVGGANTSVTLGVNTSVTVGLKMDFIAAARLSVTAGPDLHHTPTSLENTVAKLVVTATFMKDAVTALLTTSTHLTQSQITFHTTTLDVCMSELHSRV